MHDIKPYFRASHRQLDYLAYLCDELGCVNNSLYTRYTMIRASREISRLKRRLDKLQKQSRQLVLF